MAITFAFLVWFAFVDMAFAASWRRMCLDAALVLVFTTATILGWMLEHGRL